MSRGLLTNMSWSASEHAVRMALGFIVSVTLARYLGPQNFGTYTLIQSTIVMVGTLAPLAAHQILQQRLINEPSRAQATLAAGFILRLAATVCACGLGFMIISHLKSADTNAANLAAITALSIAFYPFDVIVTWFTAKLNAKAIFLARTPPFIIVSAIRVGLVLLAFSFDAIIWTIAVDGALTAIGLLVAFKLYQRHEPKIATTPSAPTAQEIQVLVADSWPVYLAFVMAGVYFRLDQLMLSWLVGEKEVGIYAVAAKISELWNFLPLVFLGTMTPLLIRAKSQSADEYNSLLRHSYTFICLSGIAISLGVCVFATPLCSLLFGSKYQLSGAVLEIHIWSILPVYIGLMSNAYLIIEGQAKIALARTAVALIANVALNALLIPPYGAVGAAVANVVSYSLLTLSLALFPATRPHLALMAQSLSPTSLREFTGLVRRFATSPR